MMILPRQARDQHRENSKSSPFLCSFGIYFNRVAAANSPLEEGNRPNPRHTTSFQVILTAEGAVKM
jgi:hypothetical protein